jgi:hypothetical protein
MKKALVITVGVGLAASSWASGFASDDATRYSSKTAWTNPTVCTCPLEPASAARIGGVSSKASLVKNDVAHVETTAILTSSYNTKLAVRSERPSEVELAPLK